MSGLAPLSAVGDQVRVHTVTEQDLAPYAEAVMASRDRLSRWNPVDPHDLARHLAAQSAAHRTFLVHARDPRGAHGIVGKVNVTNVVRGRFANGTVGYDAYDPYVGRGLMAQGLRLVVGLALRAQPDGMGLHRVEANVQPGNTTSAGLLRSLGFRREGSVRDMLWLADQTGVSDWRDHEAYAVTAQEWPAPPYQPHRPARLCLVVNGVPGSGRTTLARRLAAELSLPLFSEHHAAGALWQQLAESPVGGVVDALLSDGAGSAVGDDLRQAGLDPRGVLQVWCGELGAAHQPPELGPLEQLDAPAGLSDRGVTRIALAARAAAAEVSRG